MGISKSLGRRHKPPVLRAKAAAATADRRIVLDYPRTGEMITSSQYAFRIGTPGGMETVEILIQDGNWRPCRQAEGYWWYDWSGYADGEYHVAAKAKSRDGRTMITEPRIILVQLAS